MFETLDVLRSSTLQKGLRCPLVSRFQGLMITTDYSCVYTIKCSTIDRPPGGDPTPSVLPPGRGLVGRLFLFHKIRRVHFQPVERLFPPAQLVRTLVEHLNILEDLRKCVFTCSLTEEPGASLESTLVDQRGADSQEQTSPERQEQEVKLPGTNGSSLLGTSERAQTLERWTLPAGLLGLKVTQPGSAFLH